MEVKQKNSYHLLHVVKQLESKHPDLSYHTVILIEMMLMEWMKTPKLVTTNFGSRFYSSFSSAPWKHMK